MSENDKLIQMSIKHLHDQVSSLSNAVQKLADNQTAMNEILIRNTVTVEDHHKRSTTIEIWAAKVEDRYAETNKAVIDISNTIQNLNKTVTKHDAHVTRVDKIVNFIDGIPVVLKVVLMIVTIVSGLYGLFTFIQKILATQA